MKSEPAEVEMAARPEVDWFVDVSPKGVLGRNATGTSWVHRGTYKNQQVAIKRVGIDELETKEEVLISQLDHTNVVKLLHVKENLFKFFTLELCAASLQGFFDQDYNGPMPADVEVLCQLSSGLDYIHSKGFIYRKVKPENMLISLTTPVVMKWADFGLNQMSDSSTESSSSESLCWMSPEVLVSADGIRADSKESDIFSAGCVYFYYFTRAHPFGKKSVVKKNVMEGNPISAERLANDHFAKIVISRMIAKEPAQRITLAEVIAGLQPIPQQPSPPVVSPPTPRYVTADDITPISALEPGVNSGTIRARVVSKSRIGNWKKNAGFDMKFFTVLLRDDTGTIEAKAFSKNFERFYNQFQVGREYAIKRATLKENAYDNTKELSLGKATTVQDL
ncbi:serine/threonine-protein kinase/endoribonuclease IRE1-like [Daphnia pulicaria]|uniref:serine/threonine-protein kinase/endoribonuclease IRE1-like n=1 Tax=Daphnia pulicaria TaxID=35523 RepID=UPI001EEB6CD2|nr:serine/threonine-protein kinase/endoribonuclease IRE1-like [Daphnia pulicaria]